MPNPSAFGYIQHQAGSADGATAPVGGSVFTAQSASALNVGDIVYFTAVAGVVGKSATVLNYANLIAGVVVGGRSTNMVVPQDATAIAAGLPACTAAGQEVYVQFDGIAYIVSGAAVAAPAAVGPGAVTAGKYGANSTAGQILGTLLDTSTAANQAGRVLINVH